MRKFVCLAIVLLSACAPVVPIEPAASPVLQSAAAEINSWGVNLRSWSVDRTGRVEHRSGGRVGVPREQVTIEVRRFDLSERNRRELRDEVRRVQALLGTPEQCDMKMTDGPYGTFRWNAGAEEFTIPFSANCVKGRDHDLAAAIFAADKIVDDAAKGVQPVERRPLAAEH